MTRPLLATDRAALILQLVPYLIGEGEVSVTEAATEFEVSPQQMRDIVRSLTVIGLPGDSGYWQMAHELFDIDWDLLDEQDRIVITNAVGLERSPRLTAREAAALLTGLHVAATIPGVGGSDLFAGLLAKLTRGAADTPADLVVASEPVDHVRQVVAEALRTHRAVAFSYKAPDALPTTRTVDPVKVHIADGQWYLQGWCHLRQAMRTFHLDRVSDVVMTDIASTHDTEAVPAWFAEDDGELTVTFRYPAALAPLIGDYLDRAELRDDGVTWSATLSVADVVSLRRLATRFGGKIEIIDPPAAREAARAWADAGLALYLTPERDQ